MSQPTPARGEPTFVSPNGTLYYRHPAFRLTERQLENRRAAERRFPYPHRTVAGWLSDATTTLNYFTNLSRKRALTDVESLLLERAIFVLDGKPLRNGLAREIKAFAASGGKAPAASAAPQPRVAAGVPTLDEGRV